MRTTEIIERMEKGAVSGSRFVSQLVDTYSQKDAYLSLLEEVRSFAQRRGLPQGALDLLERHSSQGTIYVLVGEEFERLNREIAALLLNLMRDEALGEEGGSQERWREFLNKYEKIMSQSYQDFLSFNPQGSLIFEAACRLIFQQSFKEWWKQAPAELSVMRAEICMRFARELNGLFHHIRGRIATRLRFDDSLVAESLGKGLIVPELLSQLDAQTLEAAIEERGVTVSLIEQTDKIISSALREKEEREAVRILKESVISGKEDIPRLFSRRPLEVSEKGLSAVKEILLAKGEELKRRAASELEESTKSLGTHQKTFVDGIEGMSEGFRSLAEGISTAEDSVLLGEEMRERVDVLARFLDRSLWSLKELRKREQELRKTVMSGQALAELKPEEIRELIRRGGTGGALIRLCDTYERLRESGGGLKKLDFKARRELTRALKEEERRHGGTEKVKLLDGIIGRPMLRKTYDLDELVRRYEGVVSEVVEPLVVSKTVEQMLRVWPPQVEDDSELEESSLLDEARYIGEILAIQGALYQLCAGDDVRFDFSPPSEETDLAKIVKENCSQLVSLLVYDIRGSTFMGKKLGDARVESEIRNKFNKRMIAISRKLGGFPVKDTGDGGIIFFSGNSDELYQNSYLPRRDEDTETVRQALSVKGRRGICIATESAERAIKCAIGMVAEAQGFVEENLSRYTDWFGKAEETTLLYEGITYAKLPPQYKRIFKIGVGVASGSPDADLSFGFNSYGDLDVTGNLVRDANLYSKVRAEEGSVILCDGPTVLNFLLNAGQFQPRFPKKTKIEGAGRGRRAAALREEVTKWWDLSKRWGEYRLSGLGAVIRRMGYQAVLGEEAEGQEPLTVEAKGVKIDEYGKMRDEKGREVKVLYEIVPEVES